MKTKQQWLDEVQQLFTNLVYKEYDLYNYISNMLDEVMNDVPEERTIHQPVGGLSNIEWTKTSTIKDHKKKFFNKD